jgi:hypothetical protein
LFRSEAKIQAALRVQRDSFADDLGFDGGGSSAELRGELSRDRWLALPRRGESGVLNVLPR